MPISELPITVAECKSLLLERFRSGGYGLSSSDKEGYRVLCYYHGAFLFVAVGDDGTSVLHLPTDEIVLNYIWAREGVQMDLEWEDGQPRWRYALTPEEQLESWQKVLTRLTPVTDSTRRFVASTLAGLAAIANRPG
ncbi:hypothetical protein HER32_14190 [Hymenobacter sp. BT18]|uniref:hypothetical protein n=1 Tax=Hymenobacter sp. BT18 TaxID=2835648 RepID=UPI00143E8071|nr:hypothetical protein [Hymenobacter sp. BT18]QIX62266.1 hypothetical protein HER32_14190 [Hymenobacter sp. BT18]